MARRGDYGKHREAEAEASRERSAKGRDIGTIPPIKNVRRRSLTRLSLRKFCETYNPDSFSLGWCDDHLKAIARIEEAVTLGALYAFAMPRGSGKTTVCRMAALWATAHAHCRYVFLIGANAEKAEDSMASVKMFVRFLPDFAADFPEISFPARAVAGVANRAAGQLCNGVSTMIEWGKDRVTLPTVPPPPNWPKSWRLRDDGFAPSSGAVLAAAGLTSEGIRGSLLTLTTGESIRPDFVLIDDPQSSESAHSRTQNVARERLVGADVLGMAGPGKTISAVMPCTVVAPGDFVDTILDRSKHPLWRGERTGILTAMPKNMDAWARYFDVYRECAGREPPDYSAANEYYVAHRAELDEGTAASWPERKFPGDVSAVQHAMNLYCRDRRAFMSEYMNAPEDESPAHGDELSPDAVAAKLNRCPRGLVPPGCTRLTAGVDVQDKVLFWLVAGWDEGFGGAVVDYGAWPAQNRPYFAASDARPTLADAYPGVSEDAAKYAGLRDLLANVLGREYLPQGGGPGRRVELCLVDSGWKTDTVHTLCRTSPFAASLLPSKGRGVQARDKPMREWSKRPGDRVGADWRIDGGRPRGRYVLFDTNAWKTFVAARLASPEGSVGCLWLPGDRPDAHQLLADHLTAEYPTVTSGRGRTLQEWKKRPDRGEENHWLDCLVMASVAASVQGLEFSAAGAAGDPAPREGGPKRVSFKEMQQKRRRAGVRG